MRECFPLTCKLTQKKVILHVLCLGFGGLDVCVWDS